MKPDGYGTGALPEESDATRVAAESGSVVAYPLERELLVSEAVVTFEAIYSSKETEGTDAIVECHHDDVLLCGHVCAVVDRH